MTDDRPPAEPAPPTGAGGPQRARGASGTPAAGKSAGSGGKVDAPAAPPAPGPAGPPPLSVTLEITAGPGEGLRTTVTPGRTFTVGRQAGNDFVVAADHALSRNHFLVKVSDRGLLIAEWRSSGGTFLNGRRLERDVPTPIATGDEITAGNSTFRLTADAGSAADTSEPPPPTPPTPAPTKPTTKPGSAEPPRRKRKTPKSVPPLPGGGTVTYPTIVPKEGAAGGPAAAPAAPGGTERSAGLDVPTDALGYRAEPPATLAAAAGVPAPPAAGPGDSPVTAASHAAALLAEDPDAALKFLARALPPRAAVAWAVDCCESVAADPAPPADLTGRNAEALAAAASWAADPTDANRRACEAAALRLNHQTPAAWCAAAAFFSCGSIAPAGGVAVPANPALVPPMLHGALTLAAVADPPAADDRRRDFAARAAAHLTAGAAGMGTPPPVPAAADASVESPAQPPTPVRKLSAPRPPGVPPRPPVPVRKGPPKLR